MMIATKQTAALATRRSCPIPGLAAPNKLRLRPAKAGREDMSEEAKRMQRDMSQRGKDIQRETEKTFRDVAQDAEEAQPRLKEFLSSVGGTGKFDVGEPQVNLLTPAFTRRREVFVGRLAMLGFAAACFWEWLLPSRPNALEQVSSVVEKANLPINPTWIGTLFVLFLVWNVLAGAAPNSPTFTPENQQDIQKRPPNRWTLGVRSWGFTKANEVLAGRLAMLGFLAALLGQYLQGGFYGPGILAQVATYFNRPADESWYASAGIAFLAWTVFSLGLAYVTGKPGTMEGENDIY